MIQTQRAKVNRSVPWSGAPDCPMHQGLQIRTAQLREFWRSLHYNSIQDTPKRSNPLRTVNSACLVHHRTVRWPRRQKLQRSESNGQVTWQAHRTVSGAPCDSSLHQTASLVVGAINTPNHPPFIASKFSDFPHLTRVIAFNTRHTKEIKSSPKSIVHSKSNSD
jgi:hypothetical protein